MTEQSCSIGGYTAAAATKNGRYLLVTPKNLNLNFPLGIGVLHLKDESKKCNLAWIFFGSQSVVLSLGTNKKIIAWAPLLIILVATAYPTSEKFSQIFQSFEPYFHDFCSIFVTLLSPIVP